MNRELQSRYLVGERSGSRSLRCGTMAIDHVLALAQRRKMTKLGRGARFTGHGRSHRIAGFHGLNDSESLVEADVPSGAAVKGIAPRSLSFSAALVPAPRASEGMGILVPMNFVPPRIVPPWIGPTPPT